MGFVRFVSIYLRRQAEAAPLRHYELCLVDVGVDAYLRPCELRGDAFFLLSLVVVRPFRVVVRSADLNYGLVLVRFLC